MRSVQNINRDFSEANEKNLSKHVVRINAEKVKNGAPEEYHDDIRGILQKHVKI